MHCLIIKDFITSFFSYMIYLKLFPYFADVALVTSLRDGMNLVSYEFVACQNMKKGVLILSEVYINSKT